MLLLVVIFTSYLKIIKTINMVRDYSWSCATSSCDLHLISQDFQNHQYGMRLILVMETFQKLDFLSWNFVNFWINYAYCFLLKNGWALLKKEQKRCVEITIYRHNALIYEKQILWEKNVPEYIIDMQPTETVLCTGKNRKKPRAERKI